MCFSCEWPWTELLFCFFFRVYFFDFYINCVTYGYVCGLFEKLQFQFNEEEVLAMMTIKCLDTGQTTTMDKMEDILKGGFE